MPLETLVLPLIPLRRGVLLPGVTVTLPVGRARSLAVLKTAKAGDEIALGFQREPKVEDPGLEELHALGVRARLQSVRRLEDGSAQVVIETLERLTFAEVVQTRPYMRIRAEAVGEIGNDSNEARALADALIERVSEVAEGGNLALAVIATASPSLVGDRIASYLNLEEPQRLELLGSLDVVVRLRQVSDRLIESIELIAMRERAEEKVRARLSKGQREVLVRERVRALQSELGEGEADDPTEALRARLAAAELPIHAQEVADRELKRLAGIPTSSPEHVMLRTYLEWIADLPWSISAATSNSIEAVAERLDADHHGLRSVKDRILEHMAVVQLSGKSSAIPVLCLAGPPGVGKTALARSIAAATGRPFARISLGGVRDEAEIRGHRRTYIGALPGRIISALRKAKANNPVILLDEIDKLGRGWQGSPEAALLELLDAEQNGTFNDHYLEVPFDLSQILFICTVNDLSELSAPLRDRLDVIDIAGYTPDEKIAIARDHLLPRAIEVHALGAERLSLSDSAVRTIIAGYTREAGVRQLARSLARICRSVALDQVRAGDSAPESVVVGPQEIERMLGRPKFTGEILDRVSLPGVAIGLAWTPVGGDVLFIETTRMPGRGRLQVTGQLGDVMKESAKAALSYVRAHAARLGIQEDFLKHSDIHLHVPAGGVPKDGPSAGVTMFTALCSLLTGRMVRVDTAMTGECTLRGRVLPVGGIKEKVLAAHRMGLKRVILPRRNSADLDDVPREIRDALEFVLVEDMSQVFEQALSPMRTEDPADEARVVLPPESSESSAVQWS